MAYSDFTLAKVCETFDLEVEESHNLFSAIQGIEPSEHLMSTLEENILLATAIGTEKARSEFLIAPILSEVRRQSNYQVGLFSGTEFNVDPNSGLIGFCDFILSRSKEQYYISAPVLIIIEAKNENIKGGLGQCIAAMIAAQIFNQRSGNAVDYIYGAVTSGTNWKFLSLEGNMVSIDAIEYYINQVNQILGILLQPLQPSLLTSSA
ncbi:MAG: hypothetical protein WCD18_11165 [Thermosynechococcaceae cyanobacterium]